MDLPGIEGFANHPIAILLSQFGLIPIIAGLCTQFFAFFLKGKWKRIPLIFYCCLWTAVAWIIGAIKLPELVNKVPNWSEGTYEWFILLVCAFTSAAISHGGHALWKKRPGQAPASRLPE